MIISVVAAKIWYLKKCVVFIGPPYTYTTVSTISEASIYKTCDYSATIASFFTIVTAAIHVSHCKAALSILLKLCMHYTRPVDWPQLLDQPSLAHSSKLVSRAGPAY